MRILLDLVQFEVSLPFLNMLLTIGGGLWNLICSFATLRPLWVFVLLARTLVLSLCSSLPPLLGALFNEVYLGFIILNPFQSNVTFYSACTLLVHIDENSTTTTMNYGAVEWVPTGCCLKYYLDHEKFLRNWKIILVCDKIGAWIKHAYLHTMPSYSPAEMNFSAAVL